MNCLSAALDYCQRGLSVIPVNGQKKALVIWTPYQTKKASTEEITAWWGEWPGARIGIVTGVVSGLLVVDVDSKEGEEKINELLPDTLLTPACQTPRGGKHLYFACSDSRVGNATGILPGVDVRANGGYVVAPPSKGYSWLAGLAIGEIIPLALEVLPESLLSLINRYSFNNIYKQSVTEARYKPLQALHPVTLSFGEGTRDESIFHVGNCAFKGGMNLPNIQHLLESIAKNCCIPPFPERELPVKIKSIMDRACRRERRFADEVSTWVAVTDGYWSVTDCYRELQAVTKEDRGAIRIALKRMKDNGILEKSGERDGTYRKVEQQFNFVDISEVGELESIDLRWPLGVEEYARVSPKSVVVVAGDTDAGKSAFLCNFSHLNLDKKQIYYFSSELTAQRFKSRVSSLPRPITDWKKIKFTNDVIQNFQDAIQPNAINVIDYLELDAEKVYLAGNYIRKIFEKLDGGIAIIALQKKRGETIAYGRDWTMQKSELYLTISRTDDGEHILKIEKAKNWRHEYGNPYGLKRKFLITKGINFYPDTKKPDWYKNEKEEKDEWKI